MNEQFPGTLPSIENRVWGDGKVEKPLLVYIDELPSTDRQGLAVHPDITAEPSFRPEETT